MSSTVQRLISGFLEHKPIVKVLILGSYSRSAKAALVELRDRLRADGYREAHLLEDLAFRARRRNETLGQYFALKGRQHIASWADACLFIFFCKVSNMGVLSEFDFMTYQVPGLARTSSVLVEENCSFPSLTTSGTIDLSKCNQRQFKNKKELLRAARGECVTHLRNLY